MVRLAFCWLVLPFVFFSISGGKLGTYILPCYPPLAFLTAVGVLRCLRERDAKGFVIAAWIVLLATGLLLVALLVGLIAVPPSSRPVGLWKWAITAAGLLLWAILCWTAIRRDEMHKRLVYYCAGPVLFTFSLPLIIPAVLTTKKAPGTFLDSTAARITPDTVLVAEYGFTASVCWYYGRDDVYILGSGGEYEYGLDYPDSSHLNLDIQQLADSIDEQQEAKRVVLIADARSCATYKEQLPSPSYEKCHDGLVWVEYAPTSK